MPGPGLSSILKKHHNDVALVVGNGVNRYGAARETNSWNDLLLSLSRKFLHHKGKHVPKGVSLTEFYDLIELEYGQTTPERTLQREFCHLMAQWEPYDQHKHIVAWAKAANSPVLTTNFEQTLSKAGGCNLFRIAGGKHFTDFYPWESYFGDRQLGNPCEGFGIWHINGMEHYARSVRLGLTHYMGSAQRARHWFHRGHEQSLFSGKDVHNWSGARTWVHIIFNKSLVIFGIGLEEHEVFLRWLLIERARYYRKFPERAKNAWYFSVNEPADSGKFFFLQRLGVNTVSLESYDQIYKKHVWR